MLSSGTIPENENSIVMDISLMSITCPVSSEIFFEPKMVVPCGHLFEHDSITDWMKSKKTCPCCRGEIEKIIAAPPVFHELLDNALAKYPQLQRQRYFSEKVLSRAIHEKDILKVEKIIEFLTLADEHINVVVNKEQGFTLISMLTQHCLAALAKHDKFRERITADALNLVSLGVDRGTTPVAWLAGFEAGQQILLKDQIFRAKITPVGLNNIVTGDVDKGTSALYWLVKSDTGLQMLCKDNDLCAKVTEEGLNAIQMEKSISVDHDTGTSAVFFLVKAEAGLELLCRDDILRGKINAKGLNAVGKDREFLGQSPVYILVQSQRGRDLLKRDERLHKLVAVETLYVKAATTGKSPAELLKATADGIELLRKMDPNFMPVIPGLFHEHHHHHQHHHHHHDVNPKTNQVSKVS